MSIDKKEIIRLCDIVSVIKKRITLKKAGADYVAKCPFHNEKSGSLMVSPAKGIYKCFGCGKSGDAIKFVEDFDRVDFKEAINILAAEFGVSDPDVKQEKVVYKVPEPRDYQLTGARAFYMQEDRKISLATCKRLGITESMGEYIIKLKEKVEVICFNYLRQGRLINIKFRPLVAKEMQLIGKCELIPYNCDSLSISDEACITEGEIDCATLIECNILNATSTPNGGANIDWVGSFYNKKTKIIIFSDDDEAGKKFKAKLVRRLGWQRCWEVEYPQGCKDINEVLVKLGPGFVKDVYKLAKPVLPPVLDGDGQLIPASELQDPDDSLVIESITNAGARSFKPHYPGIVKWAGLMGYRWMKYSDAADSPTVMVRLVDNVLYESGEHDVVHDFKKQIDLNYADSVNMRNMLYQVTASFKNILRYLPYLDAPILTDGSTQCHLYFSNGILQITKDDAVLIPYCDAPALVWSHYIINHEYKQSTSEGNFKKFIETISVGEPHYQSILSALGYLLHAYKIRSTTKAIIIVENVDDESEARGRSGKGLIAQFVELFRNTVQEDGRNYSEDDRFKLQRVDISTQIFYINDPAKGLPLSQFYNLITDDFVVQQKGLKSYTIPFKRSPKILFTSNHLPALVSDSDRERFHLLTIEKVFGATTQIRDVFPGVLFFDKDHWPESEFNASFQLAVEAVQIWLSKGLISFKSDEMAANESRRLISAIVPDYVSEVMDQVVEAYKGAKDHVQFEHSLNSIDLEPFGDSIKKAFYWTKEGLDIHLTYYYRYVLRAYKPKINQVWFGRKLRFYLEMNKFPFEERRNSLKGRKMMVFSSGITPDLFSNGPLEPAPF